MKDDPDNHDNASKPSSDRERNQPDKTRTSRDIILNSDVGDLLNDYADRSEKLTQHQEFKIRQAQIERARRARNRLITTLAKANQKISIKMAAAMLAASTTASAVLGIYRDRILNGMYLTTYKVGIDAYTAAFTIPDFMYMVLVTGALSVSFIPVFNSRLAKGNRKSAWQLSSSTMNFLALLTLLASILIEIFAPILVKYIVGPGMSESGQALTIAMMRLLAINPFLFAIATVISSIQQAVGRFFFFALAPMIYNIGIIIGATVFTNGITIFGHQFFAGGIMGVALGVVLGAILQLLVSCLGLIGLGFDYEFKIYWKNNGFRKVLKLLPARSADQGLDYISSMIDTNLASHMADGTIRSYQQATTLYNMPINLIGVAISTAAFPKMTERISQGRPDLFKKEFRSIVRVIIWLSLPVAAISFFARGYIVSIIQAGGNATIASMFGILTMVILLRSVYQIAARSFYAQQDTKTPLLISLVTFVISVALELIMMFWLGWGASSLAIGQVIWAALEITTQWFIMQRRLDNVFNRDFWFAILRMCIATAITSVVTYALATGLNLEFQNQNIMMILPKLALIGLVSLAFYMVCSLVLKLEEATPVLAYLKKIFFGHPRVQR
ncbi:MAG: murein biosynthesis integral membrane protein MurJ [Candidatus Nanoperiomorbaceae bacterium]